MMGVALREGHAAALVRLEPFGASMLVGYYGKELVFLEPMISRAKLAGAQGFPMDIPALPGAARGVRWPTRFEMAYDAEARAYRLTFSGLSAD
jgi:hypothetical protein